MYFSRSVFSSLVVVLGVPFVSATESSSSLKVYNDYLACVKADNGLSEQQCFDKILNTSMDENPEAAAVVRNLTDVFFATEQDPSKEDSTPRAMTRLQWTAICMEMQKAEGESFSESIEECFFQHLDIDIDQEEVKRRFPMDWDSYPTTMGEALNLLRTSLTGQCGDLIRPELLDTPSPQSDSPF